MNLAHQGLCPHEYDAGKVRALARRGAQEFFELLAREYPEAKKDPGLPYGGYLALEKALLRAAETWVYVNVVLPKKGESPAPCASNPKVDSPS